MFVDSSGSIWLVQGNNIYSRHGKVSLPLRKGRVLQDMDISDNIVLLFYDDCQVDVYDIIAKKKLYSTNSLNHEEVKDYQESSVIYKYRNGFFQIRNGNNKANILHWLGYANRIFEVHKSYSDAIEEIAKERMVPLVDVRSAFPAGEALGKYVCIDGIHPTEKGYALIGDAFSGFLKAALPA